MPDGAIAYRAQSSSCPLKKGGDWFKYPVELKAAGAVLSHASFGAYTVHAVTFPERKLKMLPRRSRRSASEILNEIMEDVPMERRGTLRQQVNGVIGYANNLLRQEGQKFEGAHMLRLRFLGREELRVITADPRFEAFLVAKVDELLSRTSG